MLNMKKLITKLLNAVKTDYIVEQGTSGIWTYRKWNSGIAECWGRHSWTITGWSAWGSIYETNTSYATYPTSFFVATPTVSLTHRCLSGGEGIIGVETTSGESETRTATMYLIRPVAAGGTNQTGYVDIYARGRWK